MPDRRTRLLAALLTLLTITGCGAADDVAAAPPRAYDPPFGFAAPTGQLFAGGNEVFGRDPDDLPAALVGTAIWATQEGGALRVDSTGARTPIPLPAGRYAGGRPVVTPDGASVLVAAASVVPGSGTTPPGLSLELIVLDAVSGAPTAVVPAVLPWSDQPSAPALRVAGVAAGVAVLTASTGTRRTTVAVDLAARRVLWSVDGTLAEAVLVDGPAGGVAVGAVTPAGESPTYAAASVVGLDVVSGVRRFAGPPERGVEITRAGPGLVAVFGRAAATTLSVPAATLRFVDTGGTTVRTVEAGSSYASPRCVWDEATVTVCGTEGRVTAVDATSAAPLWALPDPAANRVAPRLGTAWHGAVYGSTVNGAVVLDGRTGADRDTAPGAAPVLVNAYLGVSPEPVGLGAFGGGAPITPAIR